MRYIKSKNLKKISRIELLKEFISSYEGSLEKKFTFNYISLVNILSSSFDRFSKMVSRAKKMKIENWNSSMIENIKKKKKKKEKMRTKFSGWLCFLFCYITQNPGPFGGCAGIPRLFIRQACSSSRWAALLSSCFTKVQRRSAVALAWGHIFGCTLFLENEITRYIILSLLPFKKKKKRDQFSRIETKGSKLSTITCPRILPTCTLRLPASNGTSSRFCWTPKDRTRRISSNHEC